MEGKKKTDCQLTANEEGCHKNRCYKNITEPYGDDPVNFIMTTKILCPFPR